VTNDLKNFRDWYVKTLESLYPERDAGIAVLMISMPLLERYLRQRNSRTFLQAWHRKAHNRGVLGRGAQGAAAMSARVVAIRLRETPRFAFVVSSYEARGELPPWDG